MAAAKFDLSVFLESVDAEGHTQDLLHHGVVTLDQLATLTLEKLEEWDILVDEYDELPAQAIPKAKRLVGLSDAFVQQELLNIELYVACKNGDCSKAENRILAEANVNYCNIEYARYTPLHISAQEGRTQVVSMLLQHPVNIEARSKSERTPLSLAALNGRLPIIKLLAQNNAKIRHRDKRGNTPLHDSAQRGHLECVKFLVLNGADITQRNNGGETALDVAKRCGKHDVVTYLEEIDAVESSDFGPVDHSDAMDSLGTNVIMSITNLATRGYPGTGKTSLLDLAMGKPVAPTRKSTEFVDPPSRYLVNKSEQSAVMVWDHVTTEKMFEMLCSASKKVVEEGKDSNSHSKVKNPTTVASQADSLPKDHEHSTSGGNEQATFPENRSTQKVVDTTQLGPSPSLPRSLPPPSPPPPPPLYTIFPELLTQLANSGRSGVIFDSHWMMVTDCGGQPPFLDASALFLRNSCLEIFPLKLNKHLVEKPKPSFFIDGEPATITTSCLPLSNLQVIETLAKGVAAFQPPYTASAVELPKGTKFAIVGTFEDKMDECTETLDQKERILEEVLEPYNHTLVRSLQGKMIMPVNAVTTDEVERKRYSENLQKLITHASGVTLKVEVKLRWFGFLLSLLILSEKKEKPLPILKLDECFKIGSSLEMDESETLRAIRFFHDIGVIMHFDTPELENEVIVDAKPVLDKVSQLLSVPFTSLEFLDKYYGIIPTAQAKERLQQHGHFDHELLKALKLTEPITTQMFLDILEHVKAVVAVNGDEKHEYFMPCALDYASEEQRVPQSCSDHPPWVIRFSISRGNDVFFIPLPVGYLPVLIIFLLTKFPSEFSTGQDAKSRQYRNLINLLYKKGKLGRVYIVECHLQLEVYFTFAAMWPKECLHIRNCILEAMRLTEEHLRITEGSITKVDCFLCFCEKHSAHISHVGEYSCELKGVICEKTGEFSSCNDKCLHWIPQDQRPQTDEVDSSKQTTMPTHEDKHTSTSAGRSTPKEVCLEKGVSSTIPTTTKATSGTHDAYYSSDPTRHVKNVFSKSMNQLSIHSDIKMNWKKMFAIEENCNAQTIDCEEFGLKIHVPKGATSSPCDIVIKAIVTGDFEFPKGTKLVSGVYAISVSKKFLKPVQLEMQHCVLIENKQHTQLLKFARADCTKPHKFTILEGGVFQPDSQYGNICCQNFSRFSIIMKRIFGRSDDRQDQPSLQYYAQLFYLPTALNHWRVKFAVTTNIRVDIEQLKDELSKERYEVDCSHIVFTFANTHGQKKLTVDITTQEIQGWQIWIKTAPMTLSEQEVVEDTSIPSLDLEINAKEGTTESLYLHVPIQGIVPEKRLIIHRRLQGSRIHGYELDEQTKAIPDAVSFWNLNKYCGYTGGGAILMMFDTGISYLPAMIEKHDRHLLQIYTEDFRDVDGHGTLCAGIACGVEYRDQELAVTYSGVAPGARLAIWKGYEQKNSGKWLDQLEQMSQCLPPDVNVVVISSGIDRHDERLETVIKRLVNDNVIVVCSASNDGATTDLNIKYPAKYQDTICVGAHDRDGERCNFSPNSDRVDFLALGDNIIGPFIEKPDESWDEPKKGTSYAAPAIGGLICLILEAVYKTCGDRYRKIHNNRAMKELLRKLATKEGVIDREKLKMFFKKPGPKHYIEELEAEKFI